MITRDSGQSTVKLFERYIVNLRRSLDDLISCLKFYSLANEAMMLGDCTGNAGQC